MQESFALPHTADALLHSLTGAPIRVGFITRSRLVTTEISTGKAFIAGNKGNLSLQFNGESGWGCWNSAKAGIGTGS